MCDELRTLAWWDEPPFTGSSNVHLNTSSADDIHGVVYDSFQNAISHCCGSMPSFNLVKYPNQEEMMRNISEFTIAMPVSITRTMLAQDIDSFIRVLDSPGMAFITATPDLKTNILTDGLRCVWPLFATILILTGYAALLIWLAELTYHGPRRRLFSKRFAPGVASGFWCALVSVTTVGYGDKVPRSFLGKCVILIWILFGIGIMSAFTAAITTILSSEQAELIEPPTLHDGDKIGVMEGTLARTLVIQAGSVPVESDNFSQLHEWLHEEEIAGILMNQYYCQSLMTEMQETLDIENRQTEPIVTGYIMYYSSVKVEKLYKCMRRYALIHALDHDDDLIEQVAWKRLKRRSYAAMATMSLSNAIDEMVIAGLAATLLVLLVCAGVTELLLRRRRARQAQHSTKSSDLVIKMHKNNNTRLAVQEDSFDENGDKAE